MGSAVLLVFSITISRSCPRFVSKRIRTFDVMWNMVNKRIIVEGNQIQVSHRLTSKNESRTGRSPREKINDYWDWCFENSFSPRKNHLASPVSICLNPTFNRAITSILFAGALVFSRNFFLVHLRISKKRVLPESVLHLLNVRFAGFDLWKPLFRWNILI